MKTLFIKAKVRNGINIDEVRAWFQTLKNRMNEVRESIENEGIFVESGFLDKQGDDYFILYFMKANDFDYAFDVFSKSNLEIDKYYKEGWKKYFEGRIVLEELLDIDRIS